ncbi:MAG: glycerophosphodiester phosphodiesterase family protein [Clostridia bacterium]
MISKTLVYAHRGASGTMPGNTMAAFEKACEMGADGVTADVLFSKDHHIMVHHEAGLGQSDVGKGKIKDHTCFELRKLDMGVWFGESFKGQKMPYIEELLEFIKDKNMKLNIELKAGSPHDAGIEEKLVSIVHKYGVEDQVVYSSINHYCLVFIKKLNPQAKICAITLCTMVNPWEYLKLHDFDGYEPHYLSIHEKVIEKLKNRNIFVNVHTVNDHAHMERLVKAGASAIITDVPDKVIRIRDGLAG